MLATADPPAAAAQPPPRVVVGAKNFTEGAILAELMAQVLETQAGARVERRFNLAGTQVAFDALRTGGIDLYAEYTGTGLRDILGDDFTGAEPRAGRGTRQRRIRPALRFALARAVRVQQHLRPDDAPRGGSALWVSRPSATWRAPAALRHVARVSRTQGRHAGVAAGVSA